MATIQEEFIGEDMIIAIADFVITVDLMQNVL
jgi:hypothetical protein